MDKNDSLKPARQTTSPANLIRSGDARRAISKRPRKTQERDRAQQPHLLSAALQYAASDWAIFPVHTMRDGRCSCGRASCTVKAKHPRVLHWPDDASADPERVTEWWVRWPDANIGLATGAASGVWALDVDGEAGVASLKALEAEHGSLPRTLTSETGRGRHLFFRFSLESPVGTRAGVKPGLDVRGNGGYVILPPSQHANGKSYRWTDLVQIAAAPQWVLDLVRSGRAETPAEGPAQAQAQISKKETVDVDALSAAPAIKRLIRDGAPKGKRSEKVFAAVRALVKAGHDDETIRAVLLDPRNGLSAKPRERGASWLDSEIARARSKPDVSKAKGAKPTRRAKRPQDKATTQGPHPAEWPEPVNGAELLDAMAGTFRRFLSLPPGAAEILALWVVFAHGLDAFDHAPRLLINSPAPESGKTTALGIISKLVPNPLPASNVTAASLFRVIEHEPKPTLLIDEYDTFSETQEALSNILNSGHERGMAFVLRTIGDDHEPHQFSTWAAYVIAKIGAIKPPSLASRCIIVPMQRALPNERFERFRADRVDDALRQKVARWVKDNLDALRKADPAIPDDIRGRAADNWRPMFAIADVAGGEWPAKARAAAGALAPKRDDQTEGTQLLADIRAVFDARHDVERIASTLLVRELNNKSDSSWSEYRNFGLNEKYLSRLLRPFGIHPKQKRQGGAATRGYERADFEDAFARYVPSVPAYPPLPVTPVT